MLCDPNPNAYDVDDISTSFSILCRLQFGSSSSDSMAVAVVTRLPSLPKVRKKIILHFVPFNTEIDTHTAHRTIQKVFENLFHEKRRSEITLASMKGFTPVHTNRYTRLY